MAQHICVAVDNYVGRNEPVGDFAGDRTNGNNNLIMMIKAINPMSKCPKIFVSSGASWFLSVFNY